MTYISPVINSNRFSIVSLASSKSFLINTGPTCLYIIESDPAEASWSQISSSYLSGENNIWAKVATGWSGAGKHHLRTCFTISFSFLWAISVPKLEWWSFSSSCRVRNSRILSSTMDAVWVPRFMAIFDAIHTSSLKSKGDEWWRREGSKVGEARGVFRCCRW